MKHRTLKALTKGSARLLDCKRSLSKIGRDVTTSSVEKAVRIITEASKNVLENMAAQIPSIVERENHKTPGGSRSRFIVIARDRANGFVRYYKVSTKSNKAFAFTENIERKVSKRILKDLSDLGPGK
jgi:hypothetical protein